MFIPTVRTNLSFDEGLNQAQCFERESTLPQAERLYREILARDPYHAQALHHLGLLCFRTNRHIEGLDLVRRSVLADPANSGFYINQGILLGKLSRFDQAAAALSKAVELDPNQHHAHNNLGVTFEKPRAS